MNVTIITPTYNSEATVLDTLHSVLSQSYTNIDHIIVDGLSKDRTIELVKSTPIKGSIHIGKDKGIYDAMNKGLSLAQGDIIGILNSDDFYADDKVIERIVDIFEKTGCDCVYGDLVYVESLDTKKIKRVWVAGPYKKENFLFGWMPPHPTLFIKRELYEKFGFFDISLHSAADYELILRFLFKNEPKVIYLPKVLVHMRVGGVSNNSLSNRINANFEDRRAWKINNLKPKWFTLYAKPLRKVSQFFKK